MVNILKCVIVEFKPLVVRMATVVATWSLNKFQKKKKVECGSLGRKT